MKEERRLLSPVAGLFDELAPNRNSGEKAFFSRPSVNNEMWMFKVLLLKEQLRAFLQGFYLNLSEEFITVPSKTQFCEKCKDEVFTSVHMRAKIFMRNTLISGEVLDENILHAAVFSSGAAAVCRSVNRRPGSRLTDTTIGNKNKHQNRLNPAPPASVSASLLEELFHFHSLRSKQKQPGSIKRRLN